MHIFPIRIKFDQMESDQIVFIKILEIKMPPLGLAVDLFAR